MVTVLFDSSIIPRKFRPVVDLVSYFIAIKSVRMRGFADFSILPINCIKFLMKNGEKNTCEGVEDNGSRWHISFIWGIDVN